MHSQSIQEDQNTYNITLKTLETVREEVESIKDKAYEDGLNQREVNTKGINSSLRMIAHETRQLVSAKMNFLKEKLSLIEKKIKKTSSNLDSVSKSVVEQQSTLKLFSGIVYTVAGIFFVFGEIEFSRQTILKAWGLGVENVFAQLSLVISLACTTFVVKVVYERLIEPYYIENEGKQHTGFTLLYIFAGLSITAMIVYLGYVRAVYHKFSVITIHSDNIYNVILQQHPYMDAIAFSGMAFVCLIGGAICLTIGFKEIRNYRLYQKNVKKENRLADKLAALEKHFNKISKNYYEIKDKNEYFENKENFEQYIADQTDFYTDLYESGYSKGKNEALKNKSADELKQINDLSDKNFHELVRVLLDKQMINNNNMQEVLNHA